MSSKFLASKQTNQYDKLQRKINKLTLEPYSITDYIPSLFSSEVPPQLPAKVDVSNVSGLAAELEQKMDTTAVLEQLDKKVDVHDVYVMNGEIDRLRRLTELLINEIDEMKLDKRDSVSSFELVDN